MKRTFLLPLLALSALNTEAAANVPPATEDGPKATNDSLANAQLQDALTKGLVIYSAGEDAFAFTLVPSANGTLVAQHRSHYSHSSHASHASHSSHYSSRF